MLTKPMPSAVVFAKDVIRLASFYEHALSMSITHADQYHIVLDAENFQLVIHAIPKVVADSFEISVPPEVREDAAIKLCLPVSSIADARSKAQKLGGKILAEANEWQARGFKACDGCDLEGNVIQVRGSTP